MANGEGMEQLEMVKAFAALDGVYIDRTENDVLYQLGEYGCMKPYNPITDLALNCAARDKYRVEVDYYDKEVSIYNAGDENFIAKATVNFTDCTCRAVIECILKSTGKWV